MNHYIYASFFGIGAIILSTSLPTILKIYLKIYDKIIVVVAYILGFIPSVSSMASIFFANKPEYYTWHLDKITDGIPILFLLIAYLWIKKEFFITIQNKFSK